MVLTRFMKKILFIALIFLVSAAAFLVYAKIATGAKDFKQADDFPRDALIYVQIRDLPALIRLWNDSDLRRKYLESANYADFRSNHLALKLIERANEIDFGLGVFPDLNFASTLSESQAALAVYDIGRMEFVFVAPMSEEKILASRLFEIQSGFEEIRLDDETIVFSKEIDVDRARQRQKILFANFRGRLILATSEKYFLQTLDNIKGKTPKNRLSNEPLFRQLAEKAKPQAATVWLNQQKLNDDWYFRRYWLMSQTDQLKDLRAGLFDFAIEDKKIVEKRAFLTIGNKPSSNIKAETARRVASLIPQKTQLYKIETAEKAATGEAILDVLFDAAKISEPAQTPESRKDYYFRDWDKSWSYSYLDNDFSEQVDEIVEDEEILPDNSGEKSRVDLTKIIGAANPQVAARLFAPENLSPPMFFENRKALIFSLQNPSALNRESLENALAAAAQDHLTVNNQKADFTWTDVSFEDLPARQMTMPSLGWQIFYARRQNELIFSSSENLLKDILTTGQTAAQPAEAFEKLTVINLAGGRDCFDKVFETISAKETFSGPADGMNLFARSISSLLDVAGDVERVEIKQTSAPNFLFEEIDFVLKE